MAYPSEVGTRGDARGLGSARPGEEAETVRHALYPLSGTWAW